MCGCVCACLVGWCRCLAWRGLVCVIGVFGLVWMVWGLFVCLVGFGLCCVALCCFELVLAWFGVVWFGLVCVFSCLLVWSVGVFWGIGLVPCGCLARVFGLLCLVLYVCCWLA